MRLRSGANLRSEDDPTSRSSNQGSFSGSPSILETPGKSRSPARSASATYQTVTPLHQNSLGVDNVERVLCTNNDHCRRNPSMNDINAGTGGLLNGSNTMAGPAQNHTTAQAHAGQRDKMLPHNRCVVWMLKVFSLLLVLFFFVIPAFMKIYPAIIADVAFLNKVHWPPFINLNQPSDFGLNYTRAFKLDITDDVTVGAWHVLPGELAVKHHAGGSQLDSSQYVNLLKSGNPIVLYLHGNAGTRAGWHRVRLYKILSNARFHVVTFDYRGYGDSTGHPSENGLVEDSVSVFKWLKRQAGNDVPVYIWGHSLGSAVATMTANRICAEKVQFNGLILEAPFNNFVDAAANHPFSLPFRLMPWFTWAFIEGLKLNDIHFASDEHIKGVTVPIIILHALDDGIVPYHLGRKLYESALRHLDARRVEFVTFDGEHGYGHKHMHKSSRLVDVIMKFTKEHSRVRELSDVST